MLLRVTGLFAALLSLSLALADARACSIMPPGFNVFDGFPRSAAGTDLVSSSATIDWIELAEPPPPSACGRMDPWRDDQKSPRCRDVMANSPVFTAIVIERLKGSSPERFPLWQYDDTYAASGRNHFVDLRIMPVWEHARVSVIERAIAEGGHETLAFWEVMGVHSIPSLQPIDCGRGIAGVDGSGRYLAFRDADGVVTALEPVWRPDDSLLARLRRFATSPGEYGRIALSVEDFFVAAGGLILAKVVKCRQRSQLDFSDATIRVLRGDPGPFLTDSWSSWRQDGATIGSVREVPDFFESQHIAGCREGAKVLIAKMDFERPPQLSGGREWLIKRFPEFNGEPDKDSLAYATDWRPYEHSQVRPMLVKNNSVVVADIPTGLALTGPDTISVDQAFAWHARHHADAPQ